MRRAGFVIEEIVEYSNLESSFRTVLRGTHRKNGSTGRYLIEHKEEVLKDLSSRIQYGTFAIKDYHEKEICESGKVRRLQVLSLYDRIAVHAIMTIVDKHLQRRFIRTTGASIKERGTHDLLNYIRDDISADPAGTRYCYKFDIRKFYESIDQDIMMKCVQKVFKDERLIKILDGFVRMMPSGLSIGLRSSQGLGNLLLSVNLDHHLKDKHGVRYFYRYCDDGVVLCATKAELWKIRDIVHRLVGEIGLTVKANERVFPIEEGIDFLGYVIRPDYVRLRKRVKKKFARRMHGLISKRRKHELVSSFYGMAKHADCIRLFNQLTGIDMKSFKDLNVSYQPQDGKKRFPGVVVSIRELVNLPIIVKDFEMGIKTEQGEDRCLVAIEINGEPKKFFTNSEEMKNILTQIKEVPDGFPFEATIRAETFGKGRTKYVFS